MCTAEKSLPNRLDASEFILLMTLYFIGILAFVFKPFVISWESNFFQKSVKELGVQNFFLTPLVHKFPNI